MASRSRAAKQTRARPARDAAPATQPSTSAEPELWVLQLDLGHHDWLELRLRMMAESLVGFTVIQVSSESGPPLNVFRVDADHAGVRRYRYSRRGEGVALGTTAVPAGASGSDNGLQEAYLDALSEVDREWKSNLRRWRGSVGQIRAIGRHIVRTVLGRSRFS